MNLIAHASSALSSSASYTEGFLHPLLGPDHLLMMIGVGVLSVLTPTPERTWARPVYLVPLAFVVSLALGGWIGMEGLDLVLVEWWILASLLWLGVVLVNGIRPDLLTSLIAVVVFGFAHGNAHGGELPTGAIPAAFVAGFVCASTLCHVTGIGLGTLVTRWERIASTAKVAGAGILATAAYLAANALAAG